MGFLDSELNDSCSCGIEDEINLLRDCTHVLNIWRKHLGGDAHWFFQSVNEGWLLMKY